MRILTITPFSDLCLMMLMASGFSSGRKRLALANRSICCWAPTNKSSHRCLEVSDR